MSETPPIQNWPPLTFRWVAGFAQTGLFRLGLHQLVGALIAAVSVAFALAHGWSPVITQAIGRLPETGGMEGGHLEWAADEPVRLAESPALDIVVDQQATHALGQTADLQFEFTDTGLRLRSLSGYVAIPYLAGWSFPLNRPVLQPWWGAWESGVLFVVAVGVIAGLFVCWWVLAIGYAFPIKFIAYFQDRTVTWPGAWKAGNAALLPGALLFAAFIALYGVRLASLPALLFVGAGHLLVGWIYLLVAPFWLPKEGSGSGTKSKNPFQPPTSTGS